MGIIRKFKYYRARLRRFDRWWFPSPAEVSCARLMGCRTFTVGWLRSIRTGYPFAVIVPARWYAASYIEREVLVRTRKKTYALDFANKAMRRGIEVDGRDYHDIVTDQQRDEDLATAKWHILRLPATWLNPRSKHYNPDRVLKLISEFFV